MSISTSTDHPPTGADSLCATMAVAFEETLDGYFPLRESLRQMLQRNDCAAALVFVLHAPAMEIPGLPPEDPVPLYITQGFGCLVRQMALMVRLDADDTVVSGVADWTWWGGHRPDDRCFSDMHRLAEPAFLRGFKLPGVNGLSPSHDGAPLGDTDVEIQANLVEGQILRGRVRAQGRRICLDTAQPATEAAPAATARITCGPDLLQRRILGNVLSEL